MKKCDMIGDVKTFSLAEASSNSDGKTSGSGSSGIYLIFIGGLIGIMASVASLFLKSPEGANVLLYSTGIIGTGAALLGYRKSVDKVTAMNAGKNDNDAPKGDNSDTPNPQ